MILNICLYGFSFVRVAGGWSSPGIVRFLTHSVFWHELDSNCRRSDFDDAPRRAKVRYETLRRPVDCGRRDGAVPCL